jgi:hypothetical protein
MQKGARDWLPKIQAMFLPKRQHPANGFDAPDSLGRVLSTVGRRKRRFLNYAEHVVFEDFATCFGPGDEPASTSGFRCRVSVIPNLV